ncbi:response regulator [Winogradskyella algicola]|jgi:CheY-like chemotaxis protein|uniref:response regulator n=1 Tax=Winogradskyella algicola TaxID=2575815 RepID=UPI001108AA6B|nr:response regulator [Winogradskyella algicola]
MIRNVMIVDDNKIDLFVTKKIIEKYNPEIKTRSFTNGDSALYFLELCHKDCGSDVLAVPELILVDINMPQMDGFEFLEKVERQFNGQSTKFKIYMLTSSLYAEDISKAKNNTLCAGYLCKPLTVEKFAKVYEEHLSNMQYKKTS